MPHDTPKLTIELVPETAWHKNLRSALSRAEWDKLRQRTYQEAGHCCSICGGKGRRHPVEAHEIWEYDDEAHVQTLVGLEALCPACHLCRHFGFALIQGQGGKSYNHLMKVNSWTRQQTEFHISEAFRIHASRSCHPWELDLTWLSSAGVLGRTLG